MTDLKPCPFCGSEWVEMYEKFGVFCISCVACGVDVNLTYNKTESVKMWNKRVRE